MNFFTTGVNIFKNNYFYGIISLYMHTVFENAKGKYGNEDIINKSSKYHN